MPELPEVEAWVRELAPLVSRASIEQAGPAHIATLKTFDPPLSALAGIGRAHANEILLRAQLSPFKASTDLSAEEVERLAAAMHEDLARALELREQGKGDSVVYVIHNRLGEPCPQCGTPIARVDFEEHTIYYCPSCQTGGRLLKDRRLSRLLR